MSLVFLLISDVLLFMILLVLIRQRKSGDDGIASRPVTTEQGERILRHTAILPLGINNAWALFSSASGFRSFLSPIADIQIRVGGMLEASFEENGRIGSSDNLALEITSYLPREMIAMRIVSTPQGFPNPEIAKHLIIVIQLIPLTDGRTEIVYSMLGWKEGRVWNDFYEFFDYTNQLILQNILEKASA